MKRVGKNKVQFFCLNNKIQLRINYANPWDSSRSSILLSLVLHLHLIVLLRVLMQFLLSFLLLSSFGPFSYFLRRLLFLLTHLCDVKVIWKALIYLVLLAYDIRWFIDAYILRLLLVKHVEKVLLLLLDLRIDLHLHEFVHKWS